MMRRSQAAARLVTLTRPDPDGAGSLTSPLTAYAYDNLGGLISVTDPALSHTTYAYDAVGNLVSVTGADPDGPGPLAAPVTLYE